MLERLLILCKLSYCFRVRIIFSELIHENLVISSNKQGVIARFGAKPPKILAKIVYKSNNIMYSLTLFSVRYKWIVDLEV